MMLIIFYYQNDIGLENVTVSNTMDMNNPPVIGDCVVNPKNHLVYLVEERVFDSDTKMIHIKLKLNKEWSNEN